MPVRGKQSRAGPEENVGVDTSLKRSSKLCTVSSTFSTRPTGIWNLGASQKVKLQRSTSEPCGLSASTKPVRAQIRNLLRSKSEQLIVPAKAAINPETLLLPATATTARSGSQCRPSVWFDLSKNKTLTVSSQHDVIDVLENGSSSEVSLKKAEVASKSDLWWSPNSKDKRRNQRRMWAQSNSKATDTLWGGEHDGGQSRLVRFDLAQNITHIVPCWHDKEDPFLTCVHNTAGDGCNYAVVSKSDLWWSSQDKEKRRNADTLLIESNSDVRRFLEQASALEEHTTAAVKIAARYLGKTKVDVDVSPNVMDQVVESLLSLSAGGCDKGGGDHRGLEVPSRHLQLQSTLEAVLGQHELLEARKASFLTDEDRAEELRAFCEGQTLPQRALARKWGLIDARCAI